MQIVLVWLMHVIKYVIEKLADMITSMICFITIWPLFEHNDDARNNSNWCYSRILCPTDTGWWFQPTLCLSTNQSFSFIQLGTYAKFQSNHPDLWMVYSNAWATIKHLGGPQVAAPLLLGSYSFRTSTEERSKLPFSKVKLRFWQTMEMRWDEAKPNEKSFQDANSSEEHEMNVHECSVNSIVNKSLHAMEKHGKTEDDAIQCNEAMPLLCFSRCQMPACFNCQIPSGNGLLAKTSTHITLKYKYIHTMPVMLAQNHADSETQMLQKSWQRPAYLMSPLNQLAALLHFRLLAYRFSSLMAVDGHIPGVFMGELVIHPVFGGKSPAIELVKQVKRFIERWIS